MIEGTSATELFSQGVEWAGMAIGQDRAGNYNQARELYFKAAEALHKISAVELDEGRKQAFRDKATSYVSRCEQLNAMLGVETVTTQSQSSERWRKEEHYGDKAYKGARLLHEERKVHEAVKEYQRAMARYVDASRDADIASQHRIRDKWTRCCTAAEKITSIVGGVFNQGPSTFIRDNDDADLAEPPSSSIDNSNNRSDETNNTSEDFDPDDNSFSALEARLKNLKK